MQPPDWAQKLARDVCRSYRLPIPTRFTWRLRDRKPRSTGRVTSWDEDGGAIHITAGTLFEDQVVTVLHELAHYLSPPETNHGYDFWILNWRLQRRYLHRFKISLVWVVASEGIGNGDAMTAYFETRGYR